MNRLPTLGRHTRRPLQQIGSKQHEFILMPTSLGGGPLKNDAVTLSNYQKILWFAQASSFGHNLRYLGQFTVNGNKLGFSMLAVE